MCTHDFPRVHEQKGRYNSAEHESLRAVMRCLIANFGEDEGRRRSEGAIRAFGVIYTSELSPFGANWTRKFLEKMLPECHV
ncbi:MAG: hypothetical protein ACXWLZ_06885 [Rhizomicrobium sp.]